MVGRIVPVSIFTLAGILYLHNAWTAFPLSGFDGPFHAAYVAILRFEGRLPLAHEGWSTFHPPLYYALSASVWSLFPEGANPRIVLFALRSISVLSTLGLGLVVYRLARRLLPARRETALCAATVVLFLPMIVASASLLGNEMLASFLSAVAVFLVLRGSAPAPAVREAAVVGGVLGLAVLTKISSLLTLLAIVTGLLLHGWPRRSARGPALRAAAVIVVGVLLVSGWFFARNTIHYGKPIVLETEKVLRVMELQGFGPPRSIRSYFSPNIGLLLDPATRDKPANTAVWPVTFATAWYDVFSILIDRTTRTAVALGRVLFVCGGLITLVALLGAASLARGQPDLVLPRARVVLLTLFIVTLVGYLAFTYRVATPTALKATYLSTALVAFGAFVAVGTEVVLRRGPFLRALLAAVVGTLAVSVLLLFWSGGLAPKTWNSAYFYLQAHQDPPSLRVYRYFVDPGYRPR